MLAKRVVEEHCVCVTIADAGRAGPGHRKHRAVVVPLDADNAHEGVDKDGLGICLTAHDLRAPVLVADGKAGTVRLHIALGAVVPLDAGQVSNAAGALEALGGDAADGRAVVGVHQDLAGRGAKHKLLPVGRPLHKGKVLLEILAPDTMAVHTAHNHRPVLVDDANTLAVKVPSHVAHHTLVAVVDHLLRPLALEEDPHNNEAILVAGGEFSVLLVPVQHAHGAVVALEGLIHGEISSSILLALAVFEFQDLESAVLAATSYPPLLAIPRNALEIDGVRDGDFDLLAQIDKHGCKWAQGRLPRGQQHQTGVCAHKHPTAVFEQTSFQTWRLCCLV
eukprot:m.211237 g.211237  ORF g.211237 m.211237 type:complete len:335 (+) comp15559_c1_seq23:2801-3805(+)